MGKPTFFLSYRNEIYERFAGLFTGEAEDTVRKEPDGDTEKGGRKTIEEAQAEMDMDKREKWAWIGIIYKLCGGDITKTEQVVNKPFIECLVWLSYEKEVL